MCVTRVLHVFLQVQLLLFILWLVILQLSLASLLSIKHTHIYQWCVHINLNHFSQASEVKRVLEVNWPEPPALSRSCLCVCTPAQRLWTTERQPSLAACSDAPWNTHRRSVTNTECSVSLGGRSPSAWLTVTWSPARCNKRRLRLWRWRSSSPRILYWPCSSRSSCTRERFYNRTCAQTHIRQVSVWLCKIYLSSGYKKAS